MSRIDVDDDDGSSRQRYRGVEGDMATIRLYQVEDLVDEDLPLPPVNLRRKIESVATRSETNNVPFLVQHERIIQNMSLVTPMPSFVIRRAWPWRLVGLIRTALDRNPAFEGFRKNLPHLPGSEEVDGNEAAPLASLLDPLRFSFWMSCNMPFSEKEKLDLLAMHCHIKRLQYIYQKVLEQEQREAFVCCKTCSYHLSRTSNVFTVGGAEGTTGAYVNEYGIVHQTVTLRQVDEQNVFCSGSPERRDRYVLWVDSFRSWIQCLLTAIFGHLSLLSFVCSWFPGYSWTIAYCNICHSHLGWKFDLVSTKGESSRNSEEDRPEFFWGLSGASITTTTRFASSRNQRSALS